MKTKEKTIGLGAIWRPSEKHDIISMYLYIRD